MRLEVNNLKKDYKTICALNGVTAEFEPGIYALLGPNGAGKSTLIKIIVDGLQATSGEVLCDGTDISKLGSSYRKKIGYLPQNVGYYTNFTGDEFLKYMCSLKGIKGKERVKEEVERRLSQVNLTEASNRKIGTYSGGMKQRLGIAQAFLGNPELIILDEPTQGLDPKERMKFKNLMTETAKNCIIVLATHIVSDVEEIANHIMILQKGSLLSNASLEDTIKKLEGKLWEVPYGDELNILAQLVKTIIHNGKQYHHVISEKQPSPNAKLLDAGLDDIYFYYFGDESNERDD